MTPHAPQSDCILIAGYYGFGNTGDEAILEAIVREVRTIAPGSHLIVQSGNPAETWARYGIEAFLANDPVARLEAIARSRLVIIGGGGLFFDYWGVPRGNLFTGDLGGMNLYLTIALYAAFLRIPVMLWAVGVGPLLSDAGRATARAICRLASVITVRDAHSARELEAIGVSPDRIRVTADPVFSTTPRPASSGYVRDAIAAARHGNAPLIGVCLRHWDFEIDPAVWEARVGAALDLVAERIGASFVFIPFQACEESRLNDVSAAQRVRACMSPETKAAVLLDTRGVAEIWGLIGACDCVVAMRFHAGVAAATRGVPFVTLGYDPKVANLQNDMELPDFNMNVGSVDPGKLAKFIEESLAGGAALRQNIRDAAIRMGIRGRQNARAARAILTGAEFVPEHDFGDFGTFLAETLSNQVRLIAAGPAPRPPESQPRGMDAVTDYTPLISVVLPVWNHKNFVGDAIRSVLAQTWRNLELIIIDDGSDEDLSPELDAAIAGDPRARVVHREHEGLPRSLSAGFHLAQGEYFNWTSADNIMKPEALASMAQYLLKHPDVAMVYANMDLIDEGGKPLVGSDYRVSSQRAGATNELWLPHAVEPIGLVQDNYLGPCFLYRGEIGRWLGDYDGSRVGVEDYEYWLRMSISARIAHLDSEKCLYSYRVHDDTLTVRQAEAIANDVADLIRYHNARVAFCWQAFHVAIVADPDMPGLGRTAANLATALRQMRHHVTEVDPGGAPDALHTWAREVPDVKKIALYFAKCLEAPPDVLCFSWLSATAAPEITPACRILRSSKRIGESRWPLLPASGIAYQNLVLCMKARGTAFPLWGIPEPEGDLIVYLGPVEESCIDWDAVENLVSAMPHASLLFISTDGGHCYDPRIRIPSALWVGPRNPTDWYSYLSRARLLIAPFADHPGVEDLAYDVVMSYLAAGKPIVATPVIRLIGFADIPNARTSEAHGFGEAARRALFIDPDPELASACMRSKSPQAFAEALLAAANHEIYRRIDAPAVPPQNYKGSES